MPELSRSETKSSSRRSPVASTRAAQIKGAVPPRHRGEVDGDAAGDVDGGGEQLGEYDQAHTDQCGHRDPEDHLTGDDTGGRAGPDEGEHRDSEHAPGRRHPAVTILLRGEWSASSPAQGMTTTALVSVSVVDSEASDGSPEVLR